MSKSSDGHFDAIRHLRSLSNQLASIAFALDRVGMETLSNEIATIDEAITNCASVLNDVYIGKIKESVRSGEASTKAVVEAAIAGLTLGRTTNT